MNSEKKEELSLEELENLMCSIWELPAPIPKVVNGYVMVTKKKTKSGEGRKRGTC